LVQSKIQIKAISELFYITPATVVWIHSSVAWSAW